MSRASRTSYTVHIIFNVVRQIIVDNNFYVDYVDSPGRNIGCDKNPVFAGLETLERFYALRQRNGSSGFLPRDGLLP